MRSASGLPLKSGMRTSTDVSGRRRRISAIHAANTSAPRFTSIERGGCAVGDRAVRAVARTHVAEDHERGGLVLPALPDVGAMCFFTDRMQLEVAHHVLEREVVGAAGCFHLQPRGLTGWV